MGEGGERGSLRERERAAGATCGAQMIPTAVPISTRQSRPHPSCVLHAPPTLSLPSLSLPTPIHTYIQRYIYMHARIYAIARRTSIDARGDGYRPGFEVFNPLEHRRRTRAIYMAYTAFISLSGTRCSALLLRGDDGAQRLEPCHLQLAPRATNGSVLLRCSYDCGGARGSRE